MGWWLGLAPATLEFWVRFPNERNQGKQAHPVLKYRVPHGSQCVTSGLIHTGLGSSSIIAHVVHSPPPPPANSFVIGPAVINTHTVCTSNATLFDAKEGVFEDCFPSSLYAGGLPPHHV